MLLGRNGSLRSSEYGWRTFRRLHQSSCRSCLMCVLILDWNLIFRHSPSRDFALYHNLYCCYCYRRNSSGNLPKNQRHLPTSFERRIIDSLKRNHRIAIIKDWNKPRQLLISDTFIEIRQICIYPPELDQ